MLDIHTHILPKMDDGSTSSAESVSMVKACRAQGIDHLCLTPHFYPNREAPEEFLKRRMASAARLAEVLEGEKNLPRLYLGAEVAYYRGISRMECVEKLCIGKTRTLLVEMPFGEWSRGATDEILALREQRGLRVVLAHVERYLSQRNLEAIHMLNERGVFLQANAEVFLQKSMRSWVIMRMLKKEQIQFLGSDCHNMKQRSPNLGKAIERVRDKMGDWVLDYLQETQGLALGERT